MRSHIMMAALLFAPGAMLMAQDSSTTQTPQRDTIRGYNSPQGLGSRDSLQGDNALVMKIHRINQMEIKAGQLAQHNSTTSKVKSYGKQLVRDHQAADQKLTTLAQSLGVTLKDDSAGQAGQYGRDHGQGQGRDSTFGQIRDTTLGRYGQRMDTTFGHSRDTTLGRYGQRMDTTFGQSRDTTLGRYGQRGDSTMQAREQDAMLHQQMQEQMQRLGTLRGAQFDAEFVNFMAQGHEMAIKMLEQNQSSVQNADLRTFITGTLPTLRVHLQVAQSLGGITTTTTTSSIQ